MVMQIGLNDSSNSSGTLMGQNGAQPSVILFVLFICGQVIKYRKCLFFIIPFFSAFVIVIPTMTVYTSEHN